MLCRQNLIAAWITFRVNVSLSHLSATFMNHSGVGERGSGWMVSVQRAADFFCIFCQPDINLTTTSQQVYNLFCVILLHHLPKWKCSSWWTVKQNAVIISKDVHEVLQEPKILEVWLKETSCPQAKKVIFTIFQQGIMATDLYVLIQCAAGHSLMKPTITCHTKAQIQRAFF